MNEAPDTQWADAYAAAIRADAEYEAACFRVYGERGQKARKHTDASVLAAEKAAREANDRCRAIAQGRTVAELWSTHE
jgi:hypothetical protein